MTPKLLIIRFSSWGDIVQCMGVPSLFRMNENEAIIHWVTRSDFTPILSHHPSIDRVFELDRKDGLMGLIKLGFQLRNEKYTHVYDAHNNLRSHILSLILLGPRGLIPILPKWLVRRSKNRFKRWLLFKLRINQFPRPFKAQFSYLDPLNKWNIRSVLPPQPQFFVSQEVRNKVGQMTGSLPPFICLVPGAAWNMKRWPTNHWKGLIELLSDQFFVVLGGPDDKICSELRNVDPGRVVNFGGQLSMEESAAVAGQSEIVIAADTGLLHVADQLGVPSIALIGPTAFGYPSRTSTFVLEVDLDCRPCTKDGRGKCINTPYKRCMMEITPENVVSAVRQILKAREDNTIL